MNPVLKPKMNILSIVYILLQLVRNVMKTSLYLYVYRLGQTSLLNPGVHLDQLFFLLLGKAWLALLQQLQLLSVLPEHFLDVTADATQSYSIHNSRWLSVLNVRRCSLTGSMNKQVLVG